MIRCVDVHKHEPQPLSLLSLLEVWLDGSGDSPFGRIPMLSRKTKHHALEHKLNEQYGPLMDLQDLANLLRLERSTLYQQMYQNRFNIPRIRNGKKYLFQTADVAEYLVEGC